MQTSTLATTSKFYIVEKFGKIFKNMKKMIKNPFFSAQSDLIRRHHWPLLRAVRAPLPRRIPALPPAEGGCAAQFLALFPATLLESGTAGSGETDRPIGFFAPTRAGAGLCVEVRKLIFK